MGGPTAEPATASMSMTFDSTTQSEFDRSVSQSVSHRSQKILRVLWGDCSGIVTMYCNFKLIKYMYRPNFFLSQLSVDFGSPIRAQYGDPCNDGMLGIKVFEIAG